MPVYFVQAGEGGPVKIGYANEEGVIRRLYIIQSNNHVRLTLLRVLSGDAEFAMHQRFAHLRLHGEWFTYSPEMKGDLGVPDWPPAAFFRKPWPIMAKGSEEHRALQSKITRGRPAPWASVVAMKRRKQARKAHAAVAHDDREFLERRSIAVPFWEDWA